MPVVHQRRYLRGGHSHCPFRFPKPLHIHRSGQILVIALLAITILAGLVFYVFNIGSQLNRRVQMQNAADAAAISGAGWMARSMNIIAMNNVTQSRLIALALVLDSLPLAAEMTIAEETGENSLSIALKEQIDANAIPSTKNDFLLRGLDEIRRQLNRKQAGTDQTHLDVIDAVDFALDQDDEKDLENSYNVKRDTHWTLDQSGDPPHGSIWKAVVALDKLSQAVLDSAGVLAQNDAVRFGKKNHAKAIMLVPITPKLPGYRGTFEDFKTLFTDHIRVIEDPETDRFVHDVVPFDLLNRLRQSTDVLKEIERIHTSVKGGAIPGFAWPHRLGPFARVYKWRDPIGRPNANWWEADYKVLQTGYTTYGPLEHALQVVLSSFGQMGQRGGIAYTSRFSRHVRKLAILKLAYALGLNAPQKIQYSDVWIHDFEEAKKFVEKSPELAVRVRYYRVAVDSAVPWPGFKGKGKSDPKWLTGRRGEPREEKTFHSRQIRPVLTDLMTTQPLWNWSWEQQVFGNKLPVPTGKKIANHVWIRKHEYQVRDYRWFNWRPRPKLDAQREIIPNSYDMYTLYRVVWYVWGGLEIRNEVEVSNPLAGADFENLPAPILLDTQGGDYDDANGDADAGVRRELFTFLAVAKQGDEAPIWPNKFNSPNPAGATVATAQAKLFNNSSWDLWTQDWQVQLTPVSQWADWVKRIRTGIDEDLKSKTKQSSPELREQDAEFIYDYMKNLPSGLADLYTSH